MIFEIIAYFFIGIIYDVLITLYYIQVQKRSIFWSGFTSWLIVIFQITVFYELIRSSEFGILMLSYAFGCALGTAITVYYYKRNGKTSLSTFD